MTVLGTVMSGKTPELGVGRDVVVLRYEADTYDRDMDRYLASIDQALVRRMDGRIAMALDALLRDSKTCRMLIPAVGSGRLLKTLEQRIRDGIEVSGVDFNEHMMKASRQFVECAKLKGKVWLLNEDILNLRTHFAPASFDLIVWEYSGCVVVDPKEAWKLMIDILKPGGFLVYNDYIGSIDGEVLRSQHDLRDAARTVGMRWFTPSELPSQSFGDPRIIRTNGIYSAVSEGPFYSERAIVWDPTYAFHSISQASWFRTALDLIDIEVQSVDVMQSNVSAIYRAYKP